MILNKFDPKEIPRKVRTNIVFLPEVPQGMQLLSILIWRTYIEPFSGPKWDKAVVCANKDPFTAPWHRASGDISPWAYMFSYVPSFFWMWGEPLELILIIKMKSPQYLRLQWKSHTKAFKTCSPARSVTDPIYYMPNLLVWLPVSDTSII